MSRPTLLVATRSADKLREIREMLGELGDVRISSLRDAGVEETAEEDDLEVFDTFEENALAKARHFARLTGVPTLADDSGLCVDALGGAPGIRSKRWAERPDLSGAELDRANNRLLLERLRGVPDGERTAHYVCAVAVVAPGGEEAVVRGRCDGVILREARGAGGFGYDPLFFLPEERATFGELPAERKNQLSHRGRAVRLARERVRPVLDRL